MPRIFIAYAREDYEAALRLHTDLRQAGFEAWIDRRDLPPGVKWRPAIKKAIKGARYVLVLLSSTATTKKGFIHKEIREALGIVEELPESARFLIPVRLEPCESDHTLLAEINWLDLFPDYQEGLRQLVETLQAPSDTSPQMAHKAPNEDGPAPKISLAIRAFRFIEGYWETLGALLTSPKAHLREHNTGLRPQLETALQFLVPSVIPYAVFNALLPLNARQALYHILGNMFISFLIVYLSSLSLQVSWLLVGTKSPFIRYAITNCYYCAVSFLLGFGCILLAVGAVKIFDKELLRLLRQAAAGDLWPLIEAKPLENSAFVTAFAIVLIGNVALLVWTYFFWGTYREMNKASIWQSFLAFVYACILSVPVGLVATLLQQALFNFVEPQ